MAVPVRATVAPMLLVPYEKPIVEGALVRRYKRFFADCLLDDDTAVVAHTANTGAMTGLVDAGNRVLLTHHAGSAATRRKLAYSLEAVRVVGGWVGVNTAAPNALVATAVARGLVDELAGYATIRREVKYGAGGRSRVDLVLADGDRRCFVEVKSVTLREDRGPDRRAAFPDAVSERARKHVEDLARERRRGAEAAIVFVCQRGDCDAFAPAWSVDPAYAKALAAAAKKGLVVVAIEVRVDRDGLHWSRRLDVDLAPPPRARPRVAA